MLFPCVGSIVRLQDEHAVPIRVVGQVFHKRWVQMALSK